MFKIINPFKSELIIANQIQVNQSPFGLKCFLLNYLTITASGLFLGLITLMNEKILTLIIFKGNVRNITHT